MKLIQRGTTASRANRGKIASKNSIARMLSPPDMTRVVPPHSGSCQQPCDLDLVHHLAVLSAL